MCRHVTDSEYRQGDYDVRDMGNPETNVDWVLKQRLESHICLLYHQLAEYDNVMGDLYWGSVYDLPYWEYLNMPGLDENDRLFVRDGCLVLILAMAFDCIDGSGEYIRPHLAKCKAAVERLEVDNGPSQKLIEAVTTALKAVDDSSFEEKAEELQCWVHGQYVRGYFREQRQ